MNTKTYKYKLTVLSPLSVSDGENLTKLDYLADEKEKKIYVIDHNKFIKSIESKPDYKKFIENPDEDKYLKLIETTFKEEAKKSARYSINTNDTKNSDFKNKNPLNTFVKDINNKPYIPGSTIKGGIVSALIDKHYKDKSNPSNPSNEQLMKNVFTDKYKMLHNISVSDSAPVESKLIVVKKRDYNIEKKRETGTNIPLYRESLPINSKTTFSITLSPPYSHEEIEEALKYRFDLILGENGVIRKLYPDAKKYLPAALNFDDINIILGAGTGFHSKTNIMGLYHSSEKANDKAKDILDRKFGRAKHCNNKTLSPRCLKIDSSDNFLGICRLERLPE